eukprot:CAMPEP_0181220150 /NCGR_PEP_ID=MMETSP1096-20121128/28679_1 /TAXON_ID=156174 ORGANISM="Chrysochromulina ericina, Strain CCMP281" /NCGR_SAMPLE_ID=MMETSP1096 /ASSEMBLY_ACC=CAM_ASM_000453 /LENGTH=101 /DNA_ID=CAMNT_0023312625 /DNA_START=481 /DNA_END=786 /DNA_ORIENTATION=-
MAVGSSLEHIAARGVDFHHGLCEQLLDSPYLTWDGHGGSLLSKGRGGGVLSRRGLDDSARGVDDAMDAHRLQRAQAPEARLRVAEARQVTLGTALDPPARW